MFIYNVTIKVDWSIHDAWVQWMLHEHMNEMVNTGCFTHSTLLRLLEMDEKKGRPMQRSIFQKVKLIITVILKIFQQLSGKNILTCGVIVL